MPNIVSPGFKYAKNYSDTSAIAFGGDHIVHFDEVTDLGRNFYLVGTKVFVLDNSEKPKLIVFNGGLGSDFFGYKSNGFIARTSCFDKPTLTGDGTKYCNWGPIGSLAYFHNDRIGFLTEWFGYGYGLGISYRPLKNLPISTSLMVTDLFGNFPNDIADGCPDKTCKPRLYGNISWSF